MIFDWLKVLIPAYAHIKIMRYLHGGITLRTHHWYFFPLGSGLVSNWVVILWMLGTFVCMLNDPDWTNEIWATQHFIHRYHSPKSWSSGILLVSAFRLCKWRRLILVDQTLECTPVVFDQCHAGAHLRRSAIWRALTVKMLILCMLDMNSRAKCRSSGVYPRSTFQQSINWNSLISNACTHLHRIYSSHQIHLPGSTPFWGCCRW